MRLLKVIPILVTAVLLTACVPSLHPLYTEQDLASDPAFAGIWVAEEDGHKTIWTITKLGQGFEIVDVEEGEDPAKFDVHMVRLGGLTFLDLYPKQEKTNGLYELHVIRAHTFMQVTMTEDSLSVSMLDRDWLEKALTAEPTALAHQKLEGGELLLTASTAELQEFILKSCGDPAAFGDSLVFTRQQ